MRGKNMKQFLMRLLAVTVLAAMLAVLLAGCGADEGTGSTGRTGGAGSTGSIGSIGSTDDADGTDTGKKAAAYSTGEADDDSTKQMAQLLEHTLQKGELDMIIYELTTEESNQLSSEIGSVMMGAQDQFMRGTIAVKSRDWSRYASTIATEGMTFEESVLYSRLDAICLKYLEYDINASYAAKNDFYYGEAVSYGDLKLTYERAQMVYYWFKFNNPQYYFLLNGAAYDKTSALLYPMIYEQFSNGKTRAKATDELFDKLDGWIEQVNDDEVTTWQKETSANTLLCEHLVYNYDYKNNNMHDKLDQSLYSAVVMENTVCAGYAEVFTAIMSASGVKAATALSDSHAWNVVQCDNENHYAVDICWNDGDNGYDQDYLNVGEATSKRRDTGSVAYAHTYMDELTDWIPVIAQKDYVPTSYDIEGPNGSNGSGTSSTSGTVLAVPANVNMVYTKEDGARMMWDPVAEATGYQVYCTASQDIENATKSSCEADKTYVNWKKMEQGTTYYYGIRAVKTVNGEDIYSDWVDCSYVHMEDTSVLAAPANVTMTVVRENAAQMSWDSVAEATGYQIYCTASAAVENAAIHSFSAEITARSWSPMKQGTTYYYGIRAVKTVNGEDIYSDWIRLSYTHTGEASPLAAPANVKTVSTGENTAQTTWDAVPGATGYEVCLYTDATCSAIKSTYSHPAGEEYGEWKIAQGATYYYGVRAVKTVDGEDIYSDWVNSFYTHQ